MKLKQSVIRICTITFSSLLMACGESVQKFKVQVVDEASSPMPDVEVAAWFNKPGKSTPLESYKVVGTTKGKGVVEIQGETVWYQTSVSSEPLGYYKSMKFDHWTKKRNGNRWEPWPVEVKLVMKKIGNPHPMYVAAKETDGRFLIPENVSGPLGFDLLRRDWVAPHGKGERADVFLEAMKKSDAAGSASMPPGHVHLTFPNPGDGVFPAREELGGSLLFGPREAPEEGYLKEWKFANYRPAEGEKLNPVPGARPMVFRIRTELDSEGKVKTACYGKLPEGIWFSGGSVIRMTYYLNEHPNDRRLEWDMEHNLFKDITSGAPHRP